MTIKIIPKNKPSIDKPRHIDSRSSDTERKSRKFHNRRKNMIETMTDRMGQMDNQFLGIEAVGVEEGVAMSKEVASSQKVEVATRQEVVTSQEAEEEVDGEDEAHLRLTITKLWDEMRISQPKHTNNVKKNTTESLMSRRSQSIRDPINNLKDMQMKKNIVKSLSTDLTDKVGIIMKKRRHHIMLHMKIRYQLLLENRAGKTVETPGLNTKCHQQSRESRSRVSSDTMISMIMDTEIMKSKLIS